MTMAATTSYYYYYYYDYYYYFVADSNNGGCSFYLVTKLGLSQNDCRSMTIHERVMMLGGGPHPNYSSSLRGGGPERPKTLNATITPQIPASSSVSS